MRLTVSVVVHNWDAGLLLSCFESLDKAFSKALDSFPFCTFSVYLVHNGNPVRITQVDALKRAATQFCFSLNMLLDRPNLGYGAANNEVLGPCLDSPGSDTFLVMNPDVALEPNSIELALQRVTADPKCGLVCANLLDWETHLPQWGCKRYPSISVLGARLFPVLLNLPWFGNLNERYEYRESASSVIEGVELCSGCFMFASIAFWRSIGGFDPKYFMYFEDFDLSVRGRKAGWKHVYDPHIQLRHGGGGAGQKSWQHRWWFICSALRFFTRHGWRLWRVGK